MTGEVSLLGKAPAAPVTVVRLFILILLYFPCFYYFTLDGIVPVQRYAGVYERLLIQH